MSKVRGMVRGPRRAAFILGAFAASAFVLSSCVSTSGPYYGDHYTMSINRAGTGNILLKWNGPACNQDVSGDGTRGSPYDRALCAFFVIRGQECNHASGVGRGICNRATDPRAREADDGVEMWSAFDRAAHLTLQAGWSCLQVTYSGSGVVKRWTGNPLGYEGCVK